MAIRFSAHSAQSLIDHPNGALHDDVVPLPITNLAISYSHGHHYGVIQADKLVKSGRYIGVGHVEPETKEVT